MRTLCELLKYVFNLFIETEVFLDKLKNARVSPVYKAVDIVDLTNYRPISDLPCFSKTREKIMYNRLFSFVSHEKILFSKKTNRFSIEPFNRACYSTINKPNS